MITIKMFKMVILIILQKYYVLLISHDIKGGGVVERNKAAVSKLQTRGHRLEPGHR